MISPPPRGPSEAAVRGWPTKCHARDPLWAADRGGSRTAGPHPSTFCFLLSRRRKEAFPCFLSLVSSCLSSLLFSLSCFSPSRDLGVSLFVPSLFLFFFV